MHSDNVRDVLEELGYTLFPDSRGFRTNALFRGGNNKTALLIYPDGKFTDFGGEVRGNLDDLVKLTLGLKSIEDVQKWLKDKNFESILDKTSRSPQLKFHKSISESEVELLKKDYSYFINRGISKEVISLFESGVCKAGKLKDRFCFVIRSSKKQIVGISGRSLTKKFPKYKILGDKKLFVYPANLSLQSILQQKELILVESVPCVLSLYECGIKTAICTFGLDLSVSILNFIIRTSPRKIIVALNGDENGIVAAKKMVRKIKKFFSNALIINVLPPNNQKDFNDCLCSENGKEKIIEWYKKYQHKNNKIISL